MSTRKLLFRLIPLAAIAMQLPAAELVVRDLQVTLANRPSEFDYTVVTETSQTSGPDGFDGGLGLEVGGRWSFARPGDSFGLVVGVDALLDAQSYGGGDGLATTWLRLSAGPGYAISDAWTVVGGIGAQYGMSALSLPKTQSSPAFEATGTAMGYDLRMEVSWLATRRFGVGATAGWLISSHDLSGDADITIDQSGWFAGLSVIWRFIDAPPRLE